MGRLSLTFTHYFKRAFRDPMNLIFFVLLPVALMMFNMVGGLGMMDEAQMGNAQQMATVLAAVFMVSFQFFSGEVLLYSIFDDIRGDMRWRLSASPVPRRTFVIGAALASWMFNLLQAALIFGVTAVVFDVYWSEPWVMVAVVLLISVMSQLIAAVITQIAKTRKMGSGISMGLNFGMMALSGFLFIPLGDGPISTFLTTHGTPISLASRAILYAGPVLDDMSEAFFNMGILFAINMVLVVLLFVLGRRRNA